MWLIHADAQHSGHHITLEDVQENIVLGQDIHRSASPM